LFHLERQLYQAVDFHNSFATLKQNLGSKRKITDENTYDFNVNSVRGLLQGVVVGSTANLSEVHAVSIKRV
jgi:hypothetical protein